MRELVRGGMSRTRELARNEEWQMHTVPFSLCLASLQLGDGKQNHAVVTKEDMEK